MADFSFLENNSLETEASAQKINPINKTVDTVNAKLRDNIIAALKTIYDPEIPVNIYDLGLIYEINIQDETQVEIKMTLTSPMCPVAQTFPQTIQDRLLQIPELTSVAVELVWDPPWTKDCMSETAKFELNMF